MKKIVASVGLVALGASSIQSASAQTLGSPDPTKPWTVAATLRGFYDDNVGTIPNNATLPPGEHRSTFGFQVSPSAALNWVLDQTTINLGVLYSLKYYDHRPPGSADHSDQDFTFSGGLTHAFSERAKLKISDSFVIGQEPDMLRAQNTFATFQRVSGDNIRNYGSIGFDAQLTPKAGLGVGYDNAYYDYKAKGADFTGPYVNPSTAGALNRDENRAHLEGLWQVMPETKALVGYQFTQIGYTGDEVISGISGLPSTYAMSKSRDYREHTVYVGAEHNFMPNLTGSLRVGGSYSDYYNDPYTKSSWTPYVNGSLKYSYAPESSAQIGFSYDRNATDVVGLFQMGSNPAQVTVDAQSAVVYASVVHRIIPNLFGTLMAQFQNSDYNGGEFDNQSEQYYLLGLDFEYRFTQNFSAHAGYNYDRLESGLKTALVSDRSFDRNRVYIGVTASY
jgi:hypothetical protein